MSIPSDILCMKETRKFLIVNMIHKTINIYIYIKKKGLKRYWLRNSIFIFIIMCKSLKQQALVLLSIDFVNKA